MGVTKWMGEFQNGISIEGRIIDAGLMEERRFSAA